MPIARKRHKRKTREPIFLSKHLMRKQKVWRGIFWLSLLSVVTLPNLYWANRMIYHKQLQIAKPFLSPLPLAKLGDQVIIVSPHPDDETLGCAGLIQWLLEAGITPFLIVVTNGDNFDASIHLKLHEVQIKPEDRKIYARMRKQETVAAMKILGLPESQIEFLGFSERDFANEYLLEGEEKFVKVLAQKMAKFSPTSVILPSRYDDHPIHALTCSLGWSAIFKIHAEGKMKRMPMVLEVLIHCGEFPRPQGFHPSLSLVPPKWLLLTAYWYQIPLSTEMRQRKWEALKAYRTQQLPLSWRFLKSFVRANEIFAEPIFMTTQSDRKGEPRSIIAGLDITQISVSLPQGEFLQASESSRQRCVKVQLRGKVDSRFRYGIRIWQPKGSQLVMGAELLKSEKTLTARLTEGFETPAVLTAFTSYRQHILDVSPLILPEGVGQ